MAADVGGAGVQGRRDLIRPISAADVQGLRHGVLRPTQPVESTVYPGDELSDTVHFGAFHGDRLVGIASLYREPRSGMAHGWRLRGMATAPEVRGQGFGAALLTACVDHAAADGGAEMWCNARQTAIGFYRRAGFDVIGEKFEVEDIGPHVVMARAVPGPSTG